MSTPYLLDRGHADRLLWLASILDSTPQLDDALIDSLTARKRAAATEAGHIHPYVAIPLVLLAAAAWGWFHSSSAPNGATVFAVLVIASTVGILWAFGRWWHHADQAAKAYTKDVESRLQTDTSGDHIWDA